MQMHYTVGYGGHLNYHTTCGKEIHSHDEKEKATIHPEKVNCEKCQQSTDWQQDLKDLQADSPGIKRRIFIESDVPHADKIEMAQNEVTNLCDAKGVKYVRRVFSEILDYAWHTLDNTWNAVKKADEIYADSSLIPLAGGSYMGAPVIFNGMCERAIAENITGKDVYILTRLAGVYWGMIDIPLMKKAFKHNNLFMQDERGELQKVDVTKIKKR